MFRAVDRKAINQKLATYLGCDMHFFCGSMSGAWEVRKLLSQEGWLSRDQFVNDSGWESLYSYRITFSRDNVSVTVESDILDDAPVAVAIAAIIALEGKSTNGIMEIRKSSGIFSLREKISG